MSPSPQRYNSRTDKKSYRIRFLWALLVAEFIALGFFRFWPQRDEENDQVFRLVENQPIQIEQVLPTVQQASVPPPPRPNVPVIAPEYEIVEEDIIIEDIALDIPTLSEIVGEGQGINENEEAGAPVANPQRPPNMIRIVEPTLEAAARDLKAEITVRFLIAPNGSVDEAYIREIRIYEDDGSSQVVQGIGKGVERAILEAAYKWKFRPAQHLGKNVRAYSTQIFSIGF